MKKGMYGKRPEMASFDMGVEGVMRFRTRILATLVMINLVFSVLPKVTMAQYEDGPFDSVSVNYLGTVISRPWAYDLMPSVMYEPSDPDRLFKMWWLGQDLQSNGPADRIYYSDSRDGQNWSAPAIVLKGQFGDGGYDATDDHLVGSPSVIRVDLNGREKYYMFYESYGTWSTVINRFFSFERGDNWITNGLSDNAGNLPDWVNSYTFERHLGFAPAFPKSGAHPVYSCEVTYAANGKTNRYLSPSSCRTGSDVHGNWRSLNNGYPVFWLYDNGGTGRKQLHTCWDGAHWNTFATDDAGCEGVPGAMFVEQLGYAASSIDSPDMIGSLQNRVALATSDDGIHWTRFKGAARGGAILAPLNEMTNMYPHSCTEARLDVKWDIHRSYGSGYPSALVRDGYLELYFSDDTMDDIRDCGGTPGAWQIRIPVEDIEDPSAYVSAQRAQVGYGSDIKWSPLFNRYFAFDLLKKNPEAVPTDPAFQQSAMIMWSAPNVDMPSGFSEFKTLFPTNWNNSTTGRWALWGAIAGDALGHTLDFPQGDKVVNTPYTAFHLFYPAIESGLGLNHHAMDLDHLLVFGFREDLAVTSFDLNNGADSTTSRTVTLNNTATGSPNYYMASESPSFSGAAWTAYTTAPSFVLSTGNGVKTVYFKVRNDAGESTTRSDTIKLSEPTKPWLTSFNLNDGASRTTSRTVTLNNTAKESPTHYMASESPSFSGAVWATYSTAPSFTLSSGNGVKSVYFKVKNDAGESGTAMDAIQLIETEKPSVTSFKLNDGASTTTNRTVTLNNTAKESPAHYMASESPSFSGAAWVSYSTAPSFTLSSGNGFKTVYFKVKNDAGESLAASDTITLNEPTTPAVHDFKINGGDDITTNRTVTLNNTASGSPTFYMVSESPSFIGASWRDYSTAPSFVLGAGNGVKTVYFKVRNGAKESVVAIDTIMLSEPTTPSVSSFNLNGGDSTTTNRTVTLSHTASGSPTHYMASESPSFSGAAWATYSTAPAFTLSSGNGVKTVYYKVKNGASESLTKSDTISLIIPTKPSVTSFKLNGGDSTTTSRTVTLNNTAKNSPTHYMASESSSFIGAAWMTTSTAPTFTLSSGSGTKRVYFKVKNVAGVSTTKSDTITLKESTRPSLNSFIINNGESSTESWTVKLNNSATGAPTHYMASESATFSSATWKTYSTAPSMNLSTGGGAKTVYLKVKNSAGESSVLTDTITLPISKPGHHRIEGYVKFSGPDGRYGIASGAKVELFDKETNQLVAIKSTNTEGQYSVLVGAGRYIVRAQYKYGAQWLVGWFDGISITKDTLSSVTQGCNITVRQDLSKGSLPKVLGHGEQGLILRSQKD